MQSNGLLKWLMIPMILLVVFVGIQLLSGKSHTPPNHEVAQLSPDEAQRLGAEGDTSQDTVATLVAQVKQLRTELQTALSENKTQREENERLRQRDGAVDRRIQNALENERTQIRQEREQAATERQHTQGLLLELQQRLDSLSNDTELPLGLGLESGTAINTESIQWVEPDDAHREDGKRTPGTGGFSFPNRIDSLQEKADTINATAQADSRTAGIPTLTPVYTLPTNATLMGSVAMTALIGRVPVDGTVNDPYPFKVLIGQDNLTANGIDMPDVAGAVVSGTASGDWTLSCVRGHIRSITFVFTDGTIRTLPEGNRSQNNDSKSSQGGLGWISDPYGIPCVTGERRSNAQQYLGSQALITAAGAGAASLIDSDTGRVAYASNDGSVGTVGISGNEAMERVLAAGAQDMSQWVNKLYGQAFAAVYVKPGAKVAVHIEDPITLDHDPVGRRVNHHNGGTAYASDLD